MKNILPVIFATELRLDFCFPLSRLDYCGDGGERVEGDEMELYFAPIKTGHSSCVRFMGHKLCYDYGDIRKQTAKTERNKSRNENNGGKDYGKNIFYNCRYKISLWAGVF